jgi:aspartyl-tRNA(Asn)/glutamyl-tRNA(Gln) amidotransferase subunit A
MKFLNQTLLDVRDQVQSGKIKSADVVSESLERIKKFDKDINAFITLNDGALKRAEDIDARIKKGEKVGRLAGVPIAVKDMYCTKGIRTTAASKILENFIPQYSATVVEKLENEGAVIIGKTNCDEFAMGSSNENSAFGVVQNPWKKGHVAGGSSGGAAAAQAARYVFGSLGTDTGGSIRQPASLCGLYGIKPTYGRVSRYGIIAYASSLDQAGPFASSTKDAAEILTSMAGFDEKDSTSSAEVVPDFAKSISTDMSKVTIGIPKEYFGEDLNPEIKAVTLNAIEVLKSQGAKFKEISLPHTKFAVPVYYLVATSEASSNLSRYDGIRFGLRKPSQDLNELYSQTRADGFGTEVKKRIMLGTFALSSGYYDAYYKKASQVRRIILNDFLAAFSGCDAIICPVTTSTAFKIGERIKDTISMYYNDIFTTSTNLAGLPGMSIPGGLSKEGLPIGVQIMAPHYKEQTIFNISQALENNLKIDLKMKGGMTDGI